MGNQIHWENIFETKDTNKVSWYQACPTDDVSLIKKYISDKTMSIIDIGGGDSALPESLLANSFSNISLLDISSNAINANQQKMGDSAKLINWIHSDVRTFQIDIKYDLWFDRAAFHFLSSKEDQVKYVNNAHHNIKQDGILILGTFSINNGPKKCSGIEVCQHDKLSIKSLFGTYFEIIDNFEKLHQTPSGSTQNFYWIVLKRK